MCMQQLTDTFLQMYVLLLQKHTHTYADSLRGQCKVYLLCGDDSGLGELELAHSFMKGKHMERRTVGSGEEKHFCYLDQPLLAQSTPKHTSQMQMQKLNHLVSMKSKCTFIIHIPGLLVQPLNTSETAQNRCSYHNKSSFNCSFLVSH